MPGNAIPKFPLCGDTLPVMMRTVLIRHHDAEIEQRVLPPWLASASDMAGMLVIRDEESQLLNRAMRETLLGAGQLCRRHGVSTLLQLCEAQERCGLGKADDCGIWDAMSARRKFLLKNGCFFCLY